MTPLVLSVFPGLGLLDAAFEAEGFCVVRGPDVLWGGDVRRFHPPALVFAGVIGGPPCQTFSRLARMVRSNGLDPGFGDLVPEFCRVVFEAAPRWFLMENLPRATVPHVAGYNVRSVPLDNALTDAGDGIGEEQQRMRRFDYGTTGPSVDLARYLRPAALMSPRRKPSVTGTHRAGKVRYYELPDLLRLQGLPADFLRDSPLTYRGKRRAIANGVPLPLGRAIAAAVRQANEGCDDERHTRRPGPNDAPTGEANAG